MSQCLSLHSLSNTKIGDIDTDQKEMSTRTHRQSKYAENDVELWYFRDGGWTLFPVQPLFGPDNGILLTQTYKQPATLEFTLPDEFGYYQPENRNSAYNLNLAGDYDALLDESRKICCRVGTRCYTNLAFNRTCTITGASPVVGATSLLTNGVTSHITSGTTQFVQMQNGGATLFASGLHQGASITVDLGGVNYIRHTCIRFASLINGGTGSASRLTATCALPSFLEVSTSTDNVTYTPVRPARPVAQNYYFNGVTTVPQSAGDWEDSVAGQEYEFAHCDIEVNARYVRWSFSNQSYPHAIGDPGYITQLVDEVAVYGGSAAALLGCNVFTGYMGDQIEFTPQGTIRALTVDVLKKCADNMETFLTAVYKLTSAGGVELADITYSLLTGSAYWKGTGTEYDAPFTGAEIGWANGGHLTGLEYPLWQGQSNSILGYCYELFNTIGWHLYADGNGVLQAVDPPSQQRIPDRVCISYIDGNYDVADCRRHRTGKQLRNKVTVQTGKSASSGSGTITEFVPDSVARYGTRFTRITDPLASTIDLRKKVASYFLRDYAWNLQTLTNTIKPTFETVLKNIFAFRAQARPNIYPLAAVIAADVANPKQWQAEIRAQELWSLVSLKHNIAHGKWDADCEWIPYVPQGPPIPDFTSLTSIGPTTVRAIATNFSMVTYPNLRTVRAYLSETGEFGTYAIWAEVDAAGFLILDIPGLIANEQVWVYLTSVDWYLTESLPSIFLSCTVGSTSQLQTCYTINDFTIGSVSTSGPDSQGYYTYRFFATWTAPSCGFTQSHIRGYVGASPPSNPTNLSSWPIQDDSFNWWSPARILQGLTWDNSTPGLLTFTLNFRSLSNLSGQTMYWIIANSARTRAWIPVLGNYDSCVVI